MSDSPLLFFVFALINLISDVDLVFHPSILFTQAKYHLSSDKKQIIPLHQFLVNDALWQIHTEQT